MTRRRPLWSWSGPRHTTTAENRTNRHNSQSKQGSLTVYQHGPRTVLTWTLLKWCGAVWPKRSRTAMRVGPRTKKPSRHGWLRLGTRSRLSPFVSCVGPTGSGFKQFIPWTGGVTHNLLKVPRWVGVGIGIGVGPGFKFWYKNDIRVFLCLFYIISNIMNNIFNKFNFIWWHVHVKMCHLKIWKSLISLKIFKLHKNKPS